MSADESPRLEVTLRPANERFDPNDDRWISQVNEFFTDLRAEAGEVRKEVTPVEGGKGGLETMILTLASSGAITAAIGLFKAWVTRDQSRCLKITLREGDKVQEIELSGAGADVSTLKGILDRALASGS